MNSHHHLTRQTTQIKLAQDKTYGINSTAKWCKEDTNRAPDAVSRYPAWELYDEKNLPELSAAAETSKCKN